MSTTECSPLSVIMALGNKKFEEADKEQNFELTAGKYIDRANGRNTVCCKQ